MSVSTTATSQSFTSTGGTTYPITAFAFFDSTELLVVKNNGGVSTTLVLGTDYSVTGGAGSTGNVITTTAIPSGVTLIVSRVTSKTQLTSYTTGDRFPASAQEKALDRLTMIAQENAQNSIPNTTSTSGSAPFVLGINDAGGTPAWVSQSSSGIADGSITANKLFTGHPTWDGSGNLSATSFVGPLTGNVTGAGNSTFAGNVGIGTSVPLRKLHLAQSTACEQILEQTDALANNRKYNAVVSGGTSSQGATYFFRLLNDAGTAATKDIYYISPDGTINANGNPITNCKTTAKAWVNFNGTFGSTPASGTYTRTSTTVRVTVGNNQTVGSQVTITGATDSTLNGTWTVTAATTTYLEFTNPNTSTTSGSLTIVAVLIRSSYNVSSITKNGSGDYSVNFATAMADANYSVCVGAGQGTSGTVASTITTAGATPTTSGFRIGFGNNGFSYTDPVYAFAQIFGN